MRRRALVALPILLTAGSARAQEGRLVVMMGKRPFGAGGEELGRVVDVIADHERRPVAAVVNAGGFMGLGSRRVALAWGLLRWRDEVRFVRLSVDVAPDVVIGAPEFRREDPSTIFDPSRDR